MFSRGFPLFNLLGFQVKLDPSWLLLALLMVWSFASGIFPFTYPNLAPVTYFWMGVGMVVGLFASIVLHEFAHAWIARCFGLPMSGITLFLFGGVAEMSEDSPSPIAELLMALAGPATSVIILLACIVVTMAGAAYEWPVSVIGVSRYLAIMNGIVIVFNLVPAFPLDGGRVLRAILWQWKHNLKWATRIASRFGGWFGLLLVFMGIFNILQGNIIGGIWWVLIGIFLQRAADSSYQQVLLQKQLQGEPVRRFMQKNVISVPMSITIQQLVDHYFYRHFFTSYPVVMHGRLLGFISIRQVENLPQPEWGNRLVADLMQPVEPEQIISPQDDAMSALSRMHQTGQSKLMVTDNNQLVGMLSLKDLLRFFAMKIALEENKPDENKPEEHKRDENK